MCQIDKDLCDDCTLNLRPVTTMSVYEHSGPSSCCLCPCLAPANLSQSVGAATGALTAEVCL